jgi:hypothetical protein
MPEETTVQLSGYGEDDTLFPRVGVAVVVTVCV